jgi:hypothetical protein
MLEKLLKEGSCKEFLDADEGADPEADADNG